MHAGDLPLDAHRMLLLKEWKDSIPKGADSYDVYLATNAFMTAIRLPGDWSLEASFIERCAKELIKRSAQLHGGKDDGQGQAEETSRVQGVRRTGPEPDPSPQDGG